VISKTDGRSSNFDSAYSREIHNLSEQVKMLEKQLEKADECLYFYSVLTDYYMSNDFELYCPEGKSMSGVEKKWGLRARNYFKEKEG